MIPEAKLIIEYEMTNPKKPVGIHVQVHGVTIGVFTIDHLERTMAKVQAAKIGDFSEWRDRVLK